jgi:hypothetical protein
MGSMGKEIKERVLRKLYGVYGEGNKRRGADKFVRGLWGRK